VPAIKTTALGSKSGFDCVFFRRFYRLVSIGLEGSLCGGNRGFFNRVTLVVYLCWILSIGYAVANFYLAQVGAQFLAAMYVTALGFCRAMQLWSDVTVAGCSVQQDKPLVIKIFIEGSCCAIGVAALNVLVQYLGAKVCV